MDMQTDSYLEELTDRAVEFEAEAQTDFLMDRPPSPLFMPAKIGVDIDTQIEHGDLFDFDKEVECILEVLVGKTLEQSMMEVLEEEELESLRRHQEKFEKLRNKEMLEVQRMEAADKRRSDEMERRMHQASAQREKDLSIMKKVIARSMAAGHLISLKDRTLQHLLDAGVLADSVEGAVESSFVPELLKSVMSEISRTRQDSQVVSAAMQTAIQVKLEIHQKVLSAERDRLSAVDAAEKKARIERQQERIRLEGERQRIEREQQALVEWELYQPPPPPEVTIASLTTEEPIKAVTSDGQEFPLLPEKVAELSAMLEESAANPEAPKMVLASLLDDPIEGSPTAPQYVDDFRLADKPQEESAPEQAEDADPPAEEA